MSDIAISVTNVSKCYRVFEDQRSRVLHTIWPGYTKGMQEVWALKDINFEIKRGDSVAIIGRNGGGKSTLLEILTGTLTPTTGSVKVNGRVSALLELGSGFNPEYSGRDNVILNGLLLGLNKKDILNRFEEIESFADIGDAIDRQVKTYSSGMVMRLAFAVQVLCDPDILIIDEALSVGDFFFQQKCLSFILNLCEKGVTLLFVSHDMRTVRDLCASAVYLHQGHLSFSGDVNAAIQRYLADIPLNEIQSKLADVPNVNHPNFKPHIEALWCASALWQKLPIDKPTQLLAVVVEDDTGNKTLTANIGETLRFVVYYQAEEVMPVHVSVVLKNRYDQVVNCTSSYTLGLEMPSSLGSNVASFTISLEMQLEAGQYSLQVILSRVGSSLNQGFTLDETPDLGPLSIIWDYSVSMPPFYGMFGLKAQTCLPRLFPLNPR